MKVTLHIHRGEGTRIEELVVELATMPREREVVRVPREGESDRYLGVTDVHHLANASSASAVAIIFCREY